jgi:hypothetical protein
MDIDALAREVANRFMRGDLTGPPLPQYLPQWMERMREEAERAYAAHPGTEFPPESEWPPFESFERAGYERIGDLDVYLYRVEPSASALLLVLRGETLAYTTFAGNRFMGPMDSDLRFPPYDLASMATGARAMGELGLTLTGMSTLREGPIHVAFEIEPARYAALEDAARETLHRACALIASDAALLFCGRSGPLHIVFIAPPDPPADNVYNVGEMRDPIAQFDVP